MIDVLMLTKADYSNTGYRFSKCLQLLGLKVSFYKGMNHWVKYPQQGEVIKSLRKARRVKNSARSTYRVPSLRPLVEEAKVIHFIASTFVDTGVDLSKKKVVVQHGGSKFRQSHARLNQIFNPVADSSIIQMPDLMGLGAKNETYISFPVDTDHLQPLFTCQDSRLLIGHFPTGVVVKGSKTILEAIKELEADPKFSNRFRYVGVKDLTVSPKKKGVSWEKNLRVVQNCDVLIDACNLKQRDKTYGEWGNAAFEAAALGTIPITHSLKVKFYESIYGKCPMHIANSKDEIVRKLKHIILMNDKELLAEKKKMRRWIVEKHSLKATAKRLWNEVYCKLVRKPR